MTRGIAFVFVALVGWLSAYASGVWPWFGYVSLEKSTFGAGGITIIGEDSQGIDFGLETFPVFAGQEIVIEYEAEIRAGSLWLYVYQPFDGQLGDGNSLYVTKSGKGQWTVPVEKTTIVHVSIDGSPTRGAGRGYDLAYTVKWGARIAQTPNRGAPGAGLRVETR